MMSNYKTAFTQFIQANNVTGSGKASSYILALDWLSKILLVEPFGFADCKNIWEIDSVERLHELYLFVLEEARKKEASEWNIRGIPPSYLQNGYCSAALKSYQSFLIENSYEQRLINIFDAYDGSEDELPDKLDVAFDPPAFLTEGLDKAQGKDVIRSVKVRSNQHVFRKIILRIYNKSCCITGLNIPEVNRASHIIPWAEDKTIRLDPRNGLCLSATYDAAFDKHLISLDDDYRLVLSKGIADYYTNESVQAYFKDKEGMPIMLPSKYLPNKTNLAVHRKNGEF